MRFTLQSLSLGGVLRFGDELPWNFLIPALILPFSSGQIPHEDSDAASVFPLPWGGVVDFNRCVQHNMWDRF
jgi:hypothetical protein